METIKLTKELRQRCIDSFTNCLDGSVKSGVSVEGILDFLVNNGEKKQRHYGNIEESFIEEHIKEYEDDFDIDDTLDF